MEKKLTIDEQKRVQLDILLEVDAFCRQNGIKYSLAYGTLLGAVRHSGYIPWDDDLDIMMPLPDMLKFQNTFNSSRIKCYGYGVTPRYENPYANVCSTYTYRKVGLFYKDRGLGIDLYPLIGLPESDSDINDFFLIANDLNEKRKKAMINQLRLKKVLPFKWVNYPQFDKIIREFTEFALTRTDYSQAKKFYLLARPMCRKDIFDYDFFDNMTDMLFEGYSFPVIADYDKVLRTLYGDYMKLPPEKDRCPHHGQIYCWKYE